MELISFIRNRFRVRGLTPPTCIHIASSWDSQYNAMSNLLFINATHGIKSGYDSTSGGGTGCRIENMNCSTLQEGLNIDYVTDTMSINNIHFRPLWYPNTSSLVTYLEAILIAWNCGYLDNAFINDIEFLFPKTCFHFHNNASPIFGGAASEATVHSMYNCQLTNIKLNLCRTGNGRSCQ